MECNSLTYNNALLIMCMMCISIIMLSWHMDMCNLVYYYFFQLCISQHQKTNRNKNTYKVTDDNEKVIRIETSALRIKISYSKLFHFFKQRFSNWWNVIFLCEYFDTDPTQSNVKWVATAVRALRTLDHPNNSNTRFRLLNDGTSMGSSTTKW